MAGVTDESKRLEAERRISAQNRSGEEALLRLSMLDWLVTIRTAKMGGDTPAADESAAKT